MCWNLKSLGKLKIERYFGRNKMKYIKMREFPYRHGGMVVWYKEY